MDFFVCEKRTGAWASVVWIHGPCIPGWLGDCSERKKNEKLVTVDRVGKSVKMFISFLNAL